MTAAPQVVGEYKDTKQRDWVEPYNRAPTDIGSLDILADTVMYVDAPKLPQNATTDLDYLLDILGQEHHLGRVRDIWSFFPAAGGQAIRPSPKDQLDAKLLSYRDLPNDWAGNESKAPHPKAVYDVLQFLQKIPRDLPLPHPQIAADGEVGLYWRESQVFAEVGFYGDGTFTYYARYTPECGPAEENWDEDLPLEDTEWPDGLVRLLNKIER